MADQRVQRRLAAILAADVVGYSRLMGADEASTRVRFNDQLDEIVQPAIDEHRGRLVKTMGDGFLVEFGSVVDAVQCAADIQTGVAVRQGREPEDRRMLLRIGVHLGDVIVEDEDIHGDGVNIAARLEGLAEPGGICVSDMVHAGVRNKLAIEFADLGDQSLRNIAEAVQVFRVVLDNPAKEGAAATDALFRRPAVAVLPFENISGDPDQEYFADGLTEDIITALSMWRYFPVISRNSSFSYKGQSPDIRKVGEELGARYVIEGSVRKAGNRVRVTAQLINTETGHHIWAERFDRDLTDIFELQDELTRRIAATVAPELDRAEFDQITATRRDLGSWDFMLRGVAHLNELTPEGAARGREMLEKAVEIDPANARALAFLAHSYQRDTILTRPYPLDDEEIKEQLSFARQAVEHGDTDSMAHVALGIACFYSGRFDDALLETERALVLNPSNFLAYTSTGHTLTMLGRPEECISLLQRALQINPQDPQMYLLLAFMTRAHFTARRYEEAVNWARQAIQRRPNAPESHLLLAVSLAYLGNLDEAHSEIETLESTHPGYADPSAWSRMYKHSADTEHYLEGIRKASSKD
jgi:adenylate cyclase